MIGQPGGMGGGLAVCGVDAAKVVIGHKDGDGVPVVFHLFGVPERATGESSVKQAHTEVEAFGAAGVDLVPVGFANLRGAPNPLDDRGIKAARSLFGGAKGFNLSAVVDGVFKRLEDCASIARVSAIAVRGQLEFCGNPLLQILHKEAAVGSVALVHQPIDHKLGVALNGQVAVKLPKLRVVGFDVLRAAVDKGVKLVNLDLLWGHIADTRVQEAGAMAPGRFKDIQHGFLVEIRQTAYGADSDTLTEQMHNMGGLGVINPHAVQGLVLAKCFPATDAAVSLHGAVAVRESAKPLCWAIAAMTRHLTLSGLCPKVTVNLLDSDFRLRPIVALRGAQTPRGSFMFGIRAGCLPLMRPRFTVYGERVRRPRPFQNSSWRAGRIAGSAEYVFRL